MLEIACDIGGTFTDLVCSEEGRLLCTAKVPSTPEDLVKGVRQGLKEALEKAGRSPEAVARFIHGTTAATNAIIERRGALTAVFMTAGFEDTLEIGRQRRHRMYDLFMDAETPDFLSPRRLRVGITERTSPEGEVVTRLDEEQVRAEARRLRERFGIEAASVCYLFSFLNLEHERRTREIIREVSPEVRVSISSEVDPRFREYERLCTTTFDAYLRPVIEDYIRRLEGALREICPRTSCHIMQSRGGLTSFRAAAEKPVLTVLSGPAAGVIGGSFAGALSGYENLITMDMGGTSTDVALVKGGAARVSAESRLDTYPLRVPMVDVKSIGAGGGSIAWLDEGGGLRVGPRSAGARPGPACYGQGGESPTVTDASLVLGYLNPDYFAGGGMALNPEAARRAVETVARPLGMDETRAAAGIHRIVNARMADQIRLVTVQQGYDPREFALLALGGAGPVHGGALMRELSVPTLIVPRIPGVLSAFGLMVANIEHEQARTFAARAGDLKVRELLAAYEELDALGREKMQRDGVPLSGVRIQRYADLRYVGQSYELEVPVPEGPEDGRVARIVEAFHRKHAQVYGHSDPKEEVEFVNLRTVHIYPLPKPSGTHEARSRGRPKPKGTRPAYFLEAGEYVETPFYEREGLPQGWEAEGPAIIEQPDTTTVIYPGQRCRVDSAGNILITHLS